jgi:RNA polymerase sigma-70 factor (ECF subfamily)
MADCEEPSVPTLRTEDPDPADPGPVDPGPEAGQPDRERQFHVLYQAYYRPILAYAVRRLGPADDAADVVADVFTAAWRRIDQVPPAPDDRLWLYGVAQRVVAGRRRSARRLRNLTARLRADHGLPRPQLPGARDASSDCLLEALDRLSPAEREALQLVLWDQLSHAEAAQVLGCSVNAVAIRVHRAKARLRADLTGRPASHTAAPADRCPPARLNRS